MPVQPYMTFARHQMILPPISTARDSFRGYRIPRLPGVEPTDQDGLICWGVVGALPSPEPMPSVGFNAKWPQEHKEQQRQSTKIRVENPDDPGQYIEVERADWIIFLTTNRREWKNAGPNTSSETPPGVADYYDNSGRLHGLIPADSPDATEEQGQLKVTYDNPNTPTGGTV